MICHKSKQPECPHILQSQPQTQR